MTLYNDNCSLLGGMCGYHSYLFDLYKFLRDFTARCCRPRTAERKKNSWPYNERKISLRGGAVGCQRPCDAVGFRGVNVYEKSVIMSVTIV